MIDDPRWYQRAVFYEVLVRGFYDSTDDGTGDLQGLTAEARLPRSGSASTASGCCRSTSRRCATAATTSATSSPCCPSTATSTTPRADRGGPPAAGIRVIADMVMNHTSDQHPWFQESRQDAHQPEGRLVRVGRRRPALDRGPGHLRRHRAVELDLRRRSAGQYFWHRFFHHQPDLNYDNPEVADAMLDVVRFWLDLGLDGFRLDAVPYLFERDGTNGENLPETHEYLRRVRKVVDDEFPGRVLLAEANQWPADVVDYFGRRRRVPHVLPLPAHAPHVHGGAAGAAPPDHRDPGPDPGDPRRLPVGHLPAQPRRADPRDGHRRGAGLHVRRVRQGPADAAQHRHRPAPVPAARQRPATSPSCSTRMLFSMPGSPVLYYGDEIGMGDNIFLGDRDGVRTPMQWTPDRNGGFSTADFAQLYLPPLMDPVYGFQAVNVEAAAARPVARSCTGCGACSRCASEHPVFGIGSFEVLDADEPVGARLPAYQRPDDRGRRRVLCVNNLSRFAAAVRADARRSFAGKMPGRADAAGVPFPPHRRAALLRHPRRRTASTGSP